MTSRDEKEWMMEKFKKEQELTQVGDGPFFTKDMLVALHTTKVG